MRVRIIDTGYETVEFSYRTPIKFGGVTLDRATILNAWVRIEGPSGRSVLGHGSMPMGNIWAFPSRRLTYEETLRAMLTAAKDVAQRYLRGPAGHPVEITHELERDWPTVAATGTNGLSEPIPLLAVLVAASPFDAALHDAYGKLLGQSAYQVLGQAFLDRDLSHFLGAGYDGLYLDQFVSPRPVVELPLYHLVGALDPLSNSDVARPIDDGWPETLEDWIARDGLTHLKIKLNGDDLRWDLNRVRGVHAVAPLCTHYSLDFNERCTSVDYLLEFLHWLRGDANSAFDRVQYIEQPTARDLANHLDQRMHAAAKLKPVVFDEGLTSYDSLLLARDMGYTGVALKACKGQTQSLLMAAAAQHFGMFLCVQDLTCPGASFVQSVGLAAHIPGVAAIEGNARQYLPHANSVWKARMPGLFGGAEWSGTVG